MADSGPRVGAIWGSISGVVIVGLIIWKYISGGGALIGALVLSGKPRTLGAKRSKLELQVRALS